MEFSPLSKILLPANKLVSSADTILSVLMIFSITCLRSLLFLRLILLILALSLPMLFFLLFGGISNQFALPVDARPFWLAVVDVEDSSWVEHVASTMEMRQLGGPKQEK